MATPMTQTMIYLETLHFAWGGKMVARQNQLIAPGVYTLIPEVASMVAVPRVVAGVE